MKIKIPITRSVSESTDSFDTQTILTTEIGISAIAADFFLHNEANMENIEDFIQSFVSFRYLGIDNYTVFESRFEILMDIGFIRYIKSAVDDKTIVDHETFMSFYRTESPAALRAKEK